MICSRLLLFNLKSLLVLFEFGIGKIMNNCAIQNACTTWEEMRSFVTVSVSISDKRGTVVCPKPRRLGLIDSFVNEPIRPVRWPMSHQSDFCEPKAGNELLDIILSRGGYEAMLSVIQQQLGGQPLNIVSGAVDEILVVLKNDTFKNVDTKEIGKLLNVISNAMFEQLVSIRRLITDYQDMGGDVVGTGGTADGDDSIDDDVGVAVEFEENEEEEEERDLDMVPDDEDDIADGHGSPLSNSQLDAVGPGIGCSWAHFQSTFILCKGDLVMKEEDNI